jgi:hypothetical protein
MTTSITGVSNQILLPEGRDDSTSIVLARQTALARSNAISGDLVEWSPRQTQNQRSGGANGYTQYRVRPYATVDEDTASSQQYQLNSAEVFSYASSISGTYGSAAAQYEFYARLFNAPSGHSFDMYM